MLIVFIFVNTTLTHSEEQGQPFKQTGTTTIFSFRYQSCTWQCSGPFCQKKTYSGCNSAISLVLVLEYTLFQLFSKWSHSFILLLPNDIFLLHLQKLFLLSTTIARMLLASRLVSR